MVRTRHLALVLATVLMLFTSAAYAQTDFPNRRIHMMVPYPAGGIVDIATRIVTDKLEAASRTRRHAFAASAEGPDRKRGGLPRD